MTNNPCNFEVERVVRDWLRTAGDRSGGRRRRETQLGCSESPSYFAAGNISENRDVYDYSVDVDVEPFSL
jgi:hypothetical protein